MTNKSKFGGFVNRYTVTAAVCALSVAGIATYKAHTPSVFKDTVTMSQTIPPLFAYDGQSTPKEVLAFYCVYNTNTGAVITVADYSEDGLIFEPARSSTGGTVPRYVGIDTTFDEVLMSDSSSYGMKLELPQKDHDKLVKIITDYYDALGKK